MTKIEWEMFIDDLFMGGQTSYIVKDGQVIDITDKIELTYFWC